MMHLYTHDYCKMSGNVVTFPPEFLGLQPLESSACLRLVGQIIRDRN